MNDASTHPQRMNTDGGSYRTDIETHQVTLHKSVQRSCMYLISYIRPNANSAHSHVA